MNGVEYVRGDQRKQLIAFLRLFGMEARSFTLVAVEVE